MKQKTTEQLGLEAQCLESKKKNSWSLPTTQSIHDGGYRHQVVSISSLLEASRGAPKSTELGFGPGMEHVWNYMHLIRENSPRSRHQEAIPKSVVVSSHQLRSPGSEFVHVRLIQVLVLSTKHRSWVWNPKTSGFSWAADQNVFH